ncbi:MBOAT family protein [Planctomicrobium sp. SH661]|uniref:MBOAT family protein n=1 Tax=Planctomicrobium sp. SH661 TaxID=3448124 RepID=UPI003F5B3653
MDVDTFLHPRGAVPVPRSEEWTFAAFKAAVGLCIFTAAAQLPESVDPRITGWIAMVGITFILHFGSFHILSCVWRRAGLQATPLMQWPIASRSVADFWGRRWNLAFRDLTHRFLFLPLVGEVGGTAALMTGFLVSGLIHDLVISWPAQGGYGSPTAYFLIQGVAILAERSQPGRRLGLRGGWTGFLFCLLVVLIPIPLLFHQAFINNVIIPFLQATRAVRCY